MNNVKEKIINSTLCIMPFGCFITGFTYTNFGVYWAFASFFGCLIIAFMFSAIIHIIKEVDDLQKRIDNLIKEKQL